MHLNLLWTLLNKINNGKIKRLINLFLVFLRNQAIAHHSCRNIGRLCKIDQLSFCVLLCLITCRLLCLIARFFILLCLLCNALIIINLNNELNGTRWQRGVSLHKNSRLRIKKHSIRTRKVKDSKDNIKKSKFLFRNDWELINISTQDRQSQYYTFNKLIRIKYRRNT